MGAGGVCGRGVAALAVIAGAGWDEAGAGVGACGGAATFGGAAATGLSAAFGAFALIVFALTDVVSFSTSVPS